MSRQDELAELRRQERLLSGLAHDLNNPLAGILGYCHLLEHETDPARRAEFLGRIREQAEVCRDALDELQVAASVPTPRPVRLTADDVLDAVLWFRRDALNELDVRREVAAGVPGFEGDLELLGRALRQLVDNALDAIDRGSRSGRITLSVTASDGVVRFSVADNGPGLREGLDGRSVFSPTVTSQRRGNGVGLGLPVALSIASVHGGDVRLVRSGPDGSEFVLELPTTDAVTSPESAAPEVLVVDDQDFILELYRDIAEHLGFEVTTALSLDEALEAVSARRYRTILCDFNLPDGTAEMLYRVAGSQTDRFIVCTGAADSPEVQDTVQRLGIRVLAKPFTVMDFERLLDD